MARDMNALLMKRLRGQQDSRGAVGQFSRGNNIYPGGSNAAQQGTGNPNIGRPATNGVVRPQSEIPNRGTVPQGANPADRNKEALRRRLQQYQQRPRGQSNK